MDTQKTRVMMVLEYFPQLTQTYIKNEIAAVAADYDVRVIAMKRPDLPYKNHHPFTMTPRPEQMVEAVQEFRPHVLHTHYLDNCDVLSRLAYDTGVPFTIRSHSFDILKQMRKGPPTREIRQIMRLVNDDACLGVLGFPYIRPFMEAAGARADKIIDCFPVVNYAAFHNPGPTGTDILNLGAALRKKKMEDFVELASLLPQRQFNLYAIGYDVSAIDAANCRYGSPIHIHRTVEPEEMPAVYRRHAWLVYTACRETNTVGWPMAVAEAQASGLGVCVPNLRPDLKQYVGDAGFVYNSIEEVKRIISQPYPDEMRQLGFEHAKKSDIQRHKHLLTDLWDKARTGVIRLDARHAPATQKTGRLLQSLLSRLKGRVGLRNQGVVG